MPRGTVEHIVGGVVAENVDATSIKGVVSKWAALKWLKEQAALTPLPAALTSGNQRYAVGDHVKIELQGAKYPHLTLFNLPPDGRVEFFIPDPGKPDEATKDWSREAIHEEFKVDKPPYGAEHMVAIFSKDELPDLDAALASMTTPDRAQALRSDARAGAFGQGRTDRGYRHLYGRGRLTCRLAGSAIRYSPWTKMAGNRSCGVQLPAAKTKHWLGFLGTGGSP